MNHEAESRTTPRRTLLLSSLSLLAALAVSASAQEKVPSPKPAGDASGESNPRATGVRLTGRLLYGDQAPDFELPTLDGKSIELREFRDRAPVVLLFVERPETAVEAYRPVAESLRAENTWLVVVSHQRMPRGAPPTTGRLVAYDRLGEVARIYGALDVVTKDLVPSLFLIDARGYVRYIAVGALPSAGALLATARGVLETSGEETVPTSTP